MLTAERFIWTHGKILGTEPNSLQRGLYESYPSARGFPGRDQNLERFEAAFVLAFTQIMFNGKEPSRTFLFSPPGSETWVKGQTKSLASALFARCKERKQPDVARYLGKMFHHLMLGNPPITREEPPCWACYGYQPDDPVPQWLLDRLHAV